MPQHLSVRWSDGHFITAITSVPMGLFQGLDFVVEIIQIERGKKDLEDIKLYWEQRKGVIRGKGGRNGSFNGR